MDSGEADHRPSISEQIGLALRVRRREEGESQRAFAARMGLSKSTLARLESSPGRMRLDDIAEALAAAGFALLVVEAAARESVGEAPVAGSGEGRLPQWIPTDLVARTRGGSRFPAHLGVHRTEWGPSWWWLDEMLRPGRTFGPQPQWSAEGSRRGDDWRPMLADTFSYGQPRRPPGEPGQSAGADPGPDPGP